MNSAFIIRIITAICTGLLTTLGIAAGIVTHAVWETKNRSQETAFSSKNSLMAFSVGTPSQFSLTEGSRTKFEGKPSVSGESIAMALATFKIRVPKGVKGPFIDLKISDRGMTIRNGALSSMTVFVGQEAFSSWSLLGSTLAHEIEVHCRQSFLSIHFQGLVGYDGVGDAEREAYSYELTNAGRFGLSDYDKALIRSTVAYYYPERSNTFVQRLKPINSWFNRLAANGFINGTF